jgi:guanylate kinase
MNPQLEHLQDFREVLANYQLPDEVKKLLNEVKLVTISSSSAVGRSTITEELLKTGKYHYIVSDTTRSPRVNNGVIEKNGTEYWFKTEAEFLDGLKNNQYIEAAIIHNQQVSGVSISELIKARDGNKVALADIDIQGVERIKKAVGNIESIFILPPSFDEWMRRLDNRGHMSDEEKGKRLNSALIELKSVVNSGYTLVINNNLSEAVGLVNSIIESGHFDETYQLNAVNLAQDLANKTADYLKQKNFN